MELSIHAGSWHCLNVQSHIVGAALHQGGQWPLIDKAFFDGTVRA
jgi:hypothetical protein